MVAHACAGMRFWRGDVADAVPIYVEAATLAEQSADPDLLAAYWAPVAVVRAGWVGPVEEAADATARIEAVVSADPRAGRATAGYSPAAVLHVARAELLRQRGASGAQAALDTAARLAREQHDGEWQVWSLAFAAHGARTTAECERALALAEEGMRLAGEFGDTAAGIIAAGAAGAAEIGLSRHAEAAEHLAGALADARRSRLALFEEARLLANLACAHLGQGDDEAARAGADEAVAVARRQGARLIEIHALLTRARIGRATGAEPAVVRADLDAARTLAIATGATAYAAEADAELTSPTPHPRG